MDDIHELTAGELLEAYRKKSLSPVDAMRGVIARVEAWEPHIKALYAYEPERALREAEASASRWMQGTPMGPLDGVPVTVKENIATKGVPVPLGTAATTLKPAEQDAPPAARLREAGAIIFSKTTMPDYGMLSSGLSSVHALTRNPWDLSKNPGGSSAGAGAAAAAGYGPLHVGTDIGGSVRLPASWCGIFTLKPSLGRIPIDPPYVGRVAGPMTRTVMDSARLMAVLSQPDPRDHMSLPDTEIPWLDLEDRDLRGARIGLMTEAGIGLPVEEAVAEAVRDAADALARLGAVVRPIKPILTREMLDGLDDFWRARSWDDISKLAPEQRAKILPYILAWAEKGADLSGLAVMRGFNRTMEMRAAAARAFLDLDYVLSPTAPIVAFPAELAGPTDDPQKPFEHIGFTVLWNMTEQPAASINCGFTESGLPIGLQIVGRRFDDIGVLRIAQLYESVREVRTVWPDPPR
jgi:aspartyl-tRNA(Asn)/glutamyl-tRNA(Gln) amidotransferase subunit A